jgi:O-antigen/teichoic acid export membrane protein
MWLLGDQALVSGFNFATSVMLARMLGLHNYGLFSVFYIVLQYGASVQNGLLLSPLLSLTPQLPPEDQIAFLQNSSGLQWLFSCACVAVFFFAAAVARTGVLRFDVPGALLLPFALTILFFQSQEWIRRRFYALGDGQSVFWYDLISYGGQVVLLALLWRIHWLSIPSAYIAIAVTSLIAFFVGWTGIASLPRWADIKAVWAPTWKLGRSLLMAIQFQWLGTQGILLIVAAMVGVNDASGMRAVITLLGPVNIFYQLLDNVVPVRTAGVYAREGQAGLSAYVRRVTLVLGGLIGVPLFLIAVFSRPIMALAFGKAFVSFAPLVLWQCLYAALALLYRMLQYYHRTIGTANVLAKSAVWVSIVSVAGCFVLIRPFGVAGALMSLVAGQAVNVAIPLRYALIFEDKEPA